MEIVLLCIGATVSKNLQAGIADYTSRIVRYVPYREVDLSDVKRKNLPQQQQKQAEGKLICEFLLPSDFVVLLDERGREYKSVEFADFISKRMSSGLKRLVFVVGGPYGFSQEVYERANSLLSLSRMTFSHEMVRLFFTEQVYRAMTILRGEPYHHE